MDLVRDFELQQTQQIDRPRLRAGDMVRVETKVTEGSKTRLQTFEGVVLGVRGSGPSTTFTVRRESGRYGVERIFPLYSPVITNIEIAKRQKVRRAKLNYLREAGRRRVKEDTRAMQRHEQEEEEKARRAEEAARKAEEAKRAEEEAEKKAKEEEKTKQEAEEENASEDSVEEKKE